MGVRMGNGLMKSAAYKAHPIRRLLLIGLLVALPVAVGGAKEVSTTIESAATEYPGHEHRVTVNRAVEVATAGKEDLAWQMLEPVLAYCDGLKATGSATLVSVSNTAEEATYIASSDATLPVRFVDMACPMAYKTAGFLAVGARDADAAFEYLDMAQQLAPYWAEPMAERAYFVGHLGDRQASLELYRSALELAEKYPGSAHVKPLVLRGIGYALIELGDLDAAQRSYEESLELDPSSEVAQNELEYIRQKRARQVTPD